VEGGIGTRRRTKRSGLWRGYRCGRRERRKLGRWEGEKVGKSKTEGWGDWGKRVESSKLKAERRGDWVRPDTGYLMPVGAKRPPARLRPVGEYWTTPRRVDPTARREIPRQRGCEEQRKTGAGREGEIKR